MLIRRNILKGIRAGRIRLAFRRWKRPTVRAGGTLMTAVGVLQVEAVDTVDPAAITDADARAAGYPDRGELMGGLDRPGTLYRIALRWASEDLRRALAETAPDARETEALRERLARMDARGPDGPWTASALRLIAAQPEVPAADLAAQAGQARDRFKTRVRRLKALGLTESLGTGYRLSPRGQVVLAALERTPESKDGQD
ncbi:MAG: hypothetical protein JJU42_04645 [Rhodobacteraceae bacterium]|nr:hypothetical protein [Paracoccaceae bacterium]